MTDYTGVKVGLVAGILLGTAATTVVTSFATDTKVEVVRIPEVHTREVPGPTKYETMPYPQACEDAGTQTRKAFRLAKNMQGMAEDISNHTKNELVPHATMGEDLAKDTAYVVGKSDAIIRAIYEWDQVGGMARWYLEKCENEIESSKEGVQPDATAADGDPFN
jgi:hypothetical protein